MRYSSKSAVEYELEQHYLLRKHYQTKCSELSAYEGFRIKEINQRKSRTFYSMKKSGESQYKYVGDASNPELQYVREFSFYKEMLKVIENNIRIMEEFLNTYRMTNTESINELLPRVYRLPRDASLLKAEPEVYKWLKDKRELKDKYPVLNPQGLTCTAFDGTPMRSRAECIHYEAFYIYNIPCVFELPYEVGNDVLSPENCHAGVPAAFRGDDRNASPFMTVL